MASVFRASTVEDQPQITELLTRVFAADASAPFASQTFLQWKYWHPRGDYSDPRSFVMERDGRIVAHVGLWPVMLHNGDRGTHMIDWASDPQVPGAGLSLLQRLMKSFDFIYSIGGSEMTQAILPKIGFKVIGDAVTLARPIRPLRQILQHQTKDIRLPLRLVRNFRWAKIPSRKVEAGWTFTHAEAPPLSCERDGHFYRYLTECPQTTCLSFSLLKDGRPCGFFAMTIVNEQARLAGMCLEESLGIRTAFYLAQQAALEHTHAAEFVARVTGEASVMAAQQSGMHERTREPVFLFCKSDHAAPTLQFHLADNDAIFMRGKSVEFLT